MYPDKDQILTSELTAEEKMALVLKNLPIGRFNGNFTEKLEQTKTMNNSGYVAAYNESDRFIDKEIVEVTYERIFGEKSSYVPETIMYGDNRWVAYVYGIDTVNNQEGYFKYKCEVCGGA